MRYGSAIIGMFGTAAVLAGLSSIPGAAAPAKPSARLQPAPAQCDLKDSADYAPGVDAYGRPVAPADAPGTRGVVVNGEVYPELRSQNPQVRGTGLAVRIEGLAGPRACPPVSKKPKD